MPPPPTSGAILSPGDRLDGRYRIEGAIAEGGMGAVYRAADEKLARTVAVKVLLPELLDDPTCVARFEREARAAASLSHPGIVQVFDFGEDRSRRIRYLVMEHVAGRTVGQTLARDGRFAPLRAAEIVEDALFAVEAAHGQGIVHRDLKPGNLMLVPLGRGGREVVKVLDFGIAQLKASAAYTRLTMTGVVVGTPAYMAPEQARAEPTDARSDVYAMGMVLWCALSGRNPYKGRDPASLVQAVLTEVPTRADLIHADVPPALAAIAERALQKPPGARFASAAEFADALAAARRAIGTSGPAPAVPVAPATEPPTAMTVPAKQGAGAPTTPDGYASDALRFPSAVAPAVVVPGVPVSSASAPPRGPSPWAWAVLAVAALAALGMAAVAVVAIAIGSGGFRAPGSSSPVPSPGSPIPVPARAAGSGAVGDACSRALSCCHALEAATHPGARSCEDVVAMSGGDASRCENQRHLWLDFARRQGIALAECE